MKQIEKFPTKLFFELLYKKCCSILEFSLSTYIDKGKDFDLVIILKNNENALFVDTGKYQKLLKGIDEISTIFAEELDINLAFFTSHRLQNYFGELHVRNRSNSFFKIHLLVYPSIRHLLTWESPSIVLSFVSNYTILVGSKLSLEVVRKKVLRSSTVDRIQPLLQLLNETFLNLSINKNTLTEKTITIKDSIEKLNYIKRFMLWELVQNSTGEVPRSDYRSIINRASKDSDLEQFVLSLKETFNSESSDVSINEIVEMYYSFIDLVGINKKLFTEKIAK